MHIHIIGIAGTMTAPLAVALKKIGHTVTGSDQDKIYPPISTLLKNAGIQLNSPLDYKNIDLAIIGSSYLSFSLTKNEFEIIKKNNTPYVSATEYIGKNIVKNNSVIVAGTAGKTTITSLITHIFCQAKLNPSYMFGGQSLNRIPSLTINQGEWSVVEGDESINGLDTKAKFLYYPTKYVVLTNADWEHKESYKDESDNFLAFKKLVENIPDNGLLIANAKGHEVDKLLQFTSAKIISYNGPKADYQIIKTEIHETSNLTIKTPTEILCLNTKLLGKFNFENILAAVALCLEIGLDPEIIKDSVASYKGIQRRLEIISNKNNIYFYDDFAQSPKRIKSAIEAIKLHYPNQDIYVYFEPHATFLQNKTGLKGLEEAFAGTKQIVLSKIHFSQRVPVANRATAKDYSDEIGDNLIYIPQNQDLYNHFCQILKPGNIFLHFSSGGREGLKMLKKIINYHKKCQDM